MAQPSQALRASGFGVTLRQDNWWLEPLATGVGFALFAIYATWAGFQGNYYEWGPYISPFYSPPVWRWFGWPEDRPLFGFFPFAGLVMWIPLLFRLTCYYYRKFYYRAYFMDPPACAVGEPAEHRYSGEVAFPLILQNLHRYALYLVIPVMLFLWIDAAKAFYYQEYFYVGLGSFVLLINVILLSGYTFGCHALRHLVGGGLDCFSCTSGTRACYGVWKKVTRLNEHHMFWAWVSMFAVWFADLYVRLLAMNIISDPHIPL